MVIFIAGHYSAAWRWEKDIVLLFGLPKMLLHTCLMLLQAGLLLPGPCPVLLQACILLLGTLFSAHAVMSCTSIPPPDNGGFTLVVNQSHCQHMLLT